MESGQLNLVAYGQQFVSIDTHVSASEDQHNEVQNNCMTPPAASKRRYDDAEPVSRSVGGDRLPRRSLEAFDVEPTVNISARIESNFVAAERSHQHVLEVLESVRLKLTTDDTTTPALLSVLAHLLNQLLDERRAAHEALTAARNLQFDAQVMLRQLQANMKHIDQIKEIHSNEQSEQNVSMWCHSFQKQQLTNIELKEKLELLSKENTELKLSAVAKEAQLREIIENLTANVTCSSAVGDEERNGVTKLETDVATIAIQTIESQSDDEDSRIARYIAQNDEVLGQAITDLEKQRALNENLQRTIREKELTLISKEQFINKVKSEMSLYKTSPNELALTLQVDDSAPAAFNRIEFAEREPQIPIREEITIENSNQIVKRYQDFIEKMSEEHRDETNKYKQELGYVTKERDAALRRIKDLQLYLDSIPSREDGSFHHQQFIDQIQAMTETVRLLEKQLSTTRIEKADAESKLESINAKLSKEQARFKHELDKQEVSCKKKSQQHEQELKQAMNETSSYMKQIEELRQQCNSYKKQASQAPTILLTALVEKMREKLIEKDRIIAELQIK
ncbi:interaptin [Hyalella azteca]|uniref:Interaptin n=1 Tax=Hyalella azteca TaxID=294128 RepID=A0A8B7NZ06_HYAAZ|nr:interaptin [Hyalella azteca]